MPGRGRAGSGQTACGVDESRLGEPRDTESREGDTVQSYYVRMPATPDPWEPSLPGFHPDPSICRGSDGYYLACSSFEYQPGIPIYFSEDLASWELVGNALDRPEHLPSYPAGPSAGIYAPCLRFRRGTFFLAYTFVDSSPTGHLLASSANPRLGWSDPVHLDVGAGIDPDLSWDEMGRCHLSWSAPGALGSAAIWQCVIDERSGTLLTEPKEVWGGAGGSYTEGPHLFEVDGMWYLLAAEGGTERGHGVVVARAPAPDGPYEALPGNPWLTHRSTNHPIQNLGHADLVRTSDHDWFMVMLGVRPRGGTPGFHVNGRETFGHWVSFSHGWPQLTGPAKVSQQDTGFRGFGRGDRIDARWVAPSQFPDDFMAMTSSGIELTVVPGKNCSLLTRIPDIEWSASVELNVQRGGGCLVVRVDERHYYAVGVEDDSVVFTMQIGDAREVIEMAPRPVEGFHVALVCSTSGLSSKLGEPPDRICAELEVGSLRVQSPWVDGRYLSTEVAGGFTGRMLGVQVTSGMLSASQFSYSPGVPDWGAWGAP